MSETSKNVCVVVLGDIGRSPRMQYHALSLSEMGHKVDIIGYGETDPHQEIKANSSVFYHYLLPCPQIPIKLLNYAFKTVVQALNLLFLLFIVRRPDVIVTQNPPAIPSLTICWLFARIVGAKLVIDWHNYAHTIMALGVGKNSPLVEITKRVEQFVGRRADANYCVTNAMKEDLWSNWKIKARTLYDKPPTIFKPISLEEKHDLFTKLGKLYEPFQSANKDDGTSFTRLQDGNVELKENRPGVLVSSTSWTEDEDFSVLLSALNDFEEHHKSGNQRNLPDLVCVITGRGHLKEYYCNKIADLDWKHVKVVTPWLESEDYPKMLASADLGVSLHTSSSGLDLPMKVVDMFGCSLVVCAYDFKCLSELVRDGENGFTFKTSDELSKQLLHWFEDFPKNETIKNVEKKFKAELENFQKLRWRENWSNVAAKDF